MNELLFGFCMLVVMIGGIVVRTQAVSLELVGKEIRRCFRFLVLAFITLWLLKALLLPILICGLVWLKGVMLRALLIVIAVTAFVLLLRVLFTRRAIKNSDRKHDQEEL